MKKFTRIFALVMTLVLVMSSMAFATPSAITNPVLSEKLKALSTAEPVKVNTASIVSPANNTISTSDSLLVSVKLTQPGTVRVSIYEECEEHVSIKTTKAAVTTSAGAVETVNVTYAAVTYSSIDTTSFEAIDFTSNPALNTYVDRVFEAPVEYVSKENIGFYTKQLSVKPGMYKIVVEVLDEEGKTAETTESLVVVKEKPAEEETPVFEQKQSGAIKLLQNLLKSLFK